MSYEDMLSKSDVIRGTIVEVCLKCPGYRICSKKLNKYTKTCGNFEKEVDIAYGYGVKQKLVKKVEK